MTDVSRGLLGPTHVPRIIRVAPEGAERPPSEQVRREGVGEAGVPGPGGVAALSLAFELSSGPIAFLDDQLCLLRANRALASLVGYEREELHGIALSRICTLDGSDTGDASTRVHLKRRDGSTRHARARVTRTPGAAGDAAFVLTIEELPESHELRASRARCTALEEQVQLARDVLDQASDAAVVHNTDRTIRYWSASAERLFGIPAEQAVGKTYAQLFGPAAAIPDSESAALFQNGSWHGELRCELPSGLVMHVERHLRVLRRGQSAWFLTTNIDVGERYRAQKESALLTNLLEQRIRRTSEQLQETAEDLRDLSYSMAHDLRAPLTSVEGFSAQLEKRLAGLDLDAASRHYLRRVRSGVATLGTMTAALITLADLGHAKLSPQTIDISALAQRVCARLRAAEVPRAVDVAIAETPAPVGDLALTNALLEHLFSNALKFTGTTPGASITFDAHTSEQGVCVFRLADNGVGFDPAYAYKLFTPFQRLHSQEEFPGTGMGLAFARKIVARHGGRIWAESAPGRGTSVFFTFHDAAAAETGGDRVKIAEDVSGWERFRATDS